jgi:hypothetical protein
MLLFLLVTSSFAQSYCGCRQFNTAGGLDSAKHGLYTGGSEARKLHSSDSFVVLHLDGTPASLSKDADSQTLRGKIGRVWIGDQKLAGADVDVRQMLTFEGKDQCTGSGKQQKLLPRTGVMAYVQVSKDKRTVFVDPCYRVEPVESYFRPNLAAFAEYVRSGGVPAVHRAAFQRMANAANAVIITRGLSQFSTDLIIEGFAPKGFAIKAKSCPWGPAAGYVVNDPRMSKAKPEWQEHKLRAALGPAKGCSTVQLHISTIRIDNLIDNGVMKVVRRTKDRVDVIAFHPVQEVYWSFAIIRSNIGSGDGSYWGVFYGEGEPTPVQVFPLHNPNGQSVLPMDPNPANYIRKEERAKDKSGVVTLGNLKSSGLSPIRYYTEAGEKTVQELGLTALHALTNPEKYAEDAGLGVDGDTSIQDFQDLYKGFYKGVAGDYDLWAILDSATSATDGNFLNDVDRKTRHHLGAISPAYRRYANALNTELGRPLVVHSTYSSNPFFDLDYPLVAFIPGQESRDFVCMDNEDGSGPQEVANFLTLCERVLLFCANRVNARVRNPKWKSQGGSSNELCQFAREQKKGDKKDYCELAPMYNKADVMFANDPKGGLLANALRRDCVVKVRLR